MLGALNPAGHAPSPARASELLLAVLVLALCGGDAAGQPCPTQCSCTGTTVDCHGQGLRSVPRNIPRNAERLDLNANNLTKITKTDFAGLRHLRVLQLMENKIAAIERGAFQDLKELERLRLNRNNLAVFPELLFLGTTKLHRLTGSVLGRDIPVYVPWPCHGDQTGRLRWPTGAK